MNDDYLDEPIELFDEAKIAEPEGLQLRLYVEPEDSHGSNIPYFMAVKLNAKPNQVIRLHYRDWEYEVHNKKANNIWEFTNKDAKMIRSVMKDMNDKHPDYTNWEYACFMWNYLNGLREYDQKTSDDEMLDNYVNGEYDKALHKKKWYVVSDQSIPHWKYVGKVPQFVINMDQYFEKD